jgi:superoxide dismutase, Fe-Mn family
MKNTLHDRREFLKTAGMAGMAAGLTFSALPSFAKEFGYASFYNIGFLQKPLPYDYNALEPHIDAMTMEIHYTKHAASYAKNLAEAAAAEGVDTKKMKLEEVLKSISKYSAKMRNNAGGHYNHELFWETMSPKSEKAPDQKLGKAIERDFGSFETFKNQFTDAAKNRFGSGWAWLLLTDGNKLVISSTPNQDNPLMDVAEIKGRPVLGLDVWEHAYYLKYQNRRPDYISSWWNVINWDHVEKRYRKMVDD